MLVRAILPDWALEQNPSYKKVREGDFAEIEIRQLNALGYNIYFLPNYPKIYDPSQTVDGSHIDTFTCVFVDMDLKDNKYPDKDSFIARLGDFPATPSRVVDSGGGVHAYWDISDLDAMSFLRLQRRLFRYFNTDQTMAKLYQLMRYWGTDNTKIPKVSRPCEILHNAPVSYTCEQLDGFLPSITKDDENYCQEHYNRTYNKHANISVNDRIPLKFAHLLRENSEVKEIWSGNINDRSTADYRLGHIMFAKGFSRDEAMSVLVNSAKALERAPTHRINYAQNIVDKVWTFENTSDKQTLTLSATVREILSRGEETIKGTRFPCHRYIDATHHGFRLGQVIGLIAGSGVGKTAIALNMFLGFVQNNPDYDHFFIPLEQPANEIADRWRTMCGDQVHLHDKVHVLSNYGEDNSYRNLSLEEIKTYLLEFQKQTGRKIGCVVIDHIGVLRQESTKNGENQGILTLCKSMKAFAIQTNTLLVMQSQAPREKAGIGDLELNKDAAYGTVFFESYSDYIVTIWQPLKRCYSEGAPTVSAFKFCKVRHKKQGFDELQEDVCYKLMFDPATELLRELNATEEKSFTFFLSKATNKRKEDRKTDLVTYTSITWSQGGVADEQPTAASHN